MINANLSRPESEEQRNVAAQILLRTGYLGPNYASRNEDRVSLINRQEDASQYAAQIDRMDSFASEEDAIPQNILARFIVVEEIDELSETNELPPLV